MEHSDQAPPFANRRPKREQRLLVDYASQVGGKAANGGLKGGVGEGM